MFFALASIAGAGLAALSNFFKKTPMSGAEKVPAQFQFSSSETVTIFSPQPMEVIGPQFHFQFIDTAYKLNVSSSPSDFKPLSLTFRNKTFEAALFPSKIQFYPDSDPPTAEAMVNIFTYPGPAEGAYNLSINEFVLDEASKMPKWVAHFDVPVIFSFNPKGREHEEEPEHEEL